MSAAGGNNTNAGPSAHLYYSCDAVSLRCPVEATTLGYYPNQPASIFFTAVFFLAGAFALLIGILKKTWSFSSFLAAGCFLETAGYGARIALKDNPWNKDAFETQIVAIILAPTLVCVSIYLTLKHVTLALSPELSRVKPRIYPFIFLPADVSCLLVQAIGGALAASASNPPNVTLLTGGNRAIIAGVALQVVVLLLFGATCVDYAVRFHRLLRGKGKSGGGGDDDAAAGQGLSAEAKVLWKDKKFRMFLGAVTVAFSAILIRCIYRIAEMAGGWGNPIMQHESTFMIFDSTMVFVACFLLSAFSPGLLFPQMAAAMNAPSSRAEKKKAKESNEGSADANANAASGGEESQDVEGRATPPAPKTEEQSTESKVLS